MSPKLVASVASLALLALSMVVCPAFADLPIDDFSQGNLTAFPMLIQVDSTSGTDPSTTVSDPGLGGVLGGVRTLTVSAVGTIPAGHNVGADVRTAVHPGLTPALCVNSSFDGHGQYDLLYDGGGVGLDLDVSFFNGIRIVPNTVDPGVGNSPVSYKVTLVDVGGNSGSATVTNGQSCFENCDEHRFLFSDFLGIDLRHIRSINVSLASDEAFDALIGPITLFGSTETAPVLSPRMISVLVGMLSVVGLVGMVRMRRTN